MTSNDHGAEVSVRAKRLTLSEILEMVLTRSAGDRSTVSISRSASGDVAIDVKVSAETVDQAGELAEAEYNRLCAAYPGRDHTATPTVALVRNAKGETQVDVKGSGWEQTQKVYDSARARYPMLDGRTAAPGTVNPGGA